MGDLFIHMQVFHDLSAGKEHEGVRSTPISDYVIKNGSTIKLKAKAVEVYQFDITSAIHDTCRVKVAEQLGVVCIW